MTRYIMGILAVAMASGAAHARVNVYSRVASLYSKAIVPASADVKAGSLWLGNCVSAKRPTDKVSGNVYFHVELDPVVGDSFYMVPNNEASATALYSEESTKAVEAVSCGRVRTVVTLSRSEDAWKTIMGNHRDNGETVFTLRKGATKDGSLALFSKTTVTGDTRGENTVYCYYWQSVTEDVDTSDPAVEPPVF